ncbi:MAG: hypothetical protein HON90_11495 [Halobacteriovoraceae bacterium]|jgi:hypothetical protein|nr:hypothetical protein [Halobacteriovoraceae bacterium]
MSELHEFVIKNMAKFSAVSCRKLYGLEAFYLSNMPFLVISSNEQIVVWVEDFEVKASLLKISQVSQWMLNDKLMENWFVLPKTYNKKKNKLSPILEMTSKVLLNPKKKKRKAKSHKIKKPVKKNLVKAVIKEKKPSFFKRIFKF